MNEQESKKTTNNEGASAKTKTTYAHSRDTRKQHTANIETQDKSFSGKTKEVGGVLGLKSERLTFEVPFDTFREKLAEYILKEFNNARNVISLVEDMEDPMSVF